MHSSIISSIVFYTIGSPGVKHQISSNAAYLIVINQPTPDQRNAVVVVAQVNQH